MALSVARPVLTSSSTPISQHAVELTTSLAKKCELASTLCTHAHVGCCFRCLPTGMETITDYMLAMFVLFMFHLSCNGPNTPSPPPPLPSRHLCSSHSGTAGSSAPPHSSVLGSLRAARIPKLRDPCTIQRFRVYVPSIQVVPQVFSSARLLSSL